MFMGYSTPLASTPPRTSSFKFHQSSIINKKKPLLMIDNYTVDGRLWNIPELKKLN